MSDADRDPLQLLQAAIDRAVEAGMSTPKAAVLATVDGAGNPSARVVNVRRVDARGLAFLTNRHSPTGEDLQRRPRADLCFHWRPLGEQVRVGGPVERIPDEEADAYWARRSRASQLGDRASRQSEALASEAELRARFAEQDEAFPDAPVPRPPEWGGFRLVPERVEFWRQGDPWLHERVRYERDGAGWRRVRLQP